MLASLLVLSVAAAQDFGQEWVDRVTHEREPANYPLSVRPVETHVEVGGVYSYDTNIFLEPGSGGHASNILIPFIGGKLDYAANRWDAAADVLIDDKQYLQHHEESGDEERVFGRLRFAGPKAQLEAAEIFQHLTDPVDVIFSKRAERFVSETTGRGALQVTPDFTVEVNALLGLIYFRDQVLDQSDNWNLRADLTGAWRFAQFLEALGQVGLLDIDYTKAGVPDASGWFFRVGVRGDPEPTLNVSILVGLTEARSQPIPPAGFHEMATTGDLAIHLRYQALEDVLLFFDYTREIGFGGSTDPFDIVDRWLALAEWQATRMLTLRGRIQYDHIHSPLGPNRNYVSLGPQAVYALSSYVHLEAGVTWRHGDLGIPGETIFKDTIGEVGFVLSR